MVYRLVDKITIAAISIGFLFLLFRMGEKGSDVAFSETLSSAVWIGVFLGIFILATITELLRTRYISCSLSLLVIALSLFIPEVTVLLPISLYGVWSDTDMEKAFEAYHMETNSRNARSALFSEKSVWIRIGMLLLAAGVISYQREFLLLILLGAAALLAIKTVFMYQHDKLVTSKYDSVRYDARKSNQQREEISHEIDMQIQNATLEERNRIAREIHDNVGHMLTRAVVQLQAIEVINQDEQTKPYIESVSATVNEAMTNIRRSVHELHDDSIDLSIGIHEIASVLKESFEVEVSTSIESPVPNQIKNAILGIVKEGVTNIAKHSNGKHVRIEVVENTTFWRVLISDDGKSERMELSRSSDFAALEGEHGIGLSNIYSRAQSCGGRTSIQGGADGFRITVTIPKKNT